MEEASVFDLDPKEFLKKKIEYYQSRIKSLKAAIRQAEETLITLDSVRSIPVEGQSNQLEIESEEIDFSTTYWKPKVFNFLFENPVKLTTEQILIGIDVSKKYQKDASIKSKAIASISSSLFQLHRSGKITKESIEGKKGNYYQIIP